jgi:ATP-dependent DNA helicase RecG
LEFWEKEETDMDVSLSGIKGIGPARLKAFNAVGIHTVRDLVMFLPKDYRDLSVFTPLNEVRPGGVYSVKVRVAGEPSQRRARKLVITKVYVTDDTETLPVVWYNQPWLKEQLTRGGN